MPSEPASRAFAGDAHVATPPETGGAAFELPIPEDLEIMAVRARISVAEACRRASVTPDVFTRWKRGTTSPSIENVRKIIAELRAAIAEVRGAT
jgi:hypothetical protein